MDDEYRLIDGNYSPKAIAYCKSKWGYLTLRQIKLHRCTRIQCTALEKMDCPYWENKAKRKRGNKDETERTGNSTNDGNKA